MERHPRTAAEIRTVVIFFFNFQSSEIRSSNPSLKRQLPLITDSFVVLINYIYFDKRDDWFGELQMSPSDCRPKNKIDKFNIFAVVLLFLKKLTIYPSIFWCLFLGRVAVRGVGWGYGGVQATLPGFYNPFLALRTFWPWHLLDLLPAMSCLSVANQVEVVVGGQCLTIAPPQTEISKVSWSQASFP